MNSLRFHQREEGAAQGATTRKWPVSELVVAFRGGPSVSPERGERMSHLRFGVDECDPAKTSYTPIGLKVEQMRELGLPGSMNQAQRGCPVFCPQDPGLRGVDHT
jgi:hypothetical protein